MKRIAAVFIISSLLMGCGLGTSQADKAVLGAETKVTSIKVGEKITEKDFAQWTVTSTAFSKKIAPSKQEEYVTFYQNTEEGCTYLDIIIQITNLKDKKEISDQFLTTSIEYDGKDEYNSCVTVENPEGQEFEFANATYIEPDQTGVLHYYASVPEEMANDSKPVKAVITCKEKVYELVIRE